MSNHDYVISFILIFLLLSASFIANVPTRVLGQVSNSPPDATDDTVDNATEDIAISINVLENDADPDGDQLTVAITVPPADGSLEINGDQSITYTPDPDFFGDDGFDYSITDTIGQSDTAHVSITIAPVNDPPVANDQSLTTEEDIPLTIVLSATDVDNSSNEITYSIATGPLQGSLSSLGGASYNYTPNSDYVGPDNLTFIANDGTDDSNTATINLTITPTGDFPVANDDSYNTPEDTSINLQVLSNDVNPDTGGGSDGLTLISVTVAANGGTVNINAIDNTITYTPPPNYSGEDSFSYTISNGDLLEDTADVTVTIDPINDPPVALPDSAFTSANIAIDVSVLENDSDIDGDTISIISVTAPSQGTAVISATDSTKISYTPALNYVGTDSFEYTISDGQGGTATALATISMNNADPIAVGDDVITDEDLAVLILVLTNDSDPNGDAITINQIVVNPSFGIAVINPEGTAITFTPNTNYNGPDSFQYSITDGQASATGTVTITVSPINDPPVATDGSDDTQENTPLSITSLSATDIDSPANSLTFSIVTGPSSGSLSGSYPINLVYTPNTNYNGPDSFIFKVTDDGGLESTASFQITVNSVNADPDADAGQDQQVNEGALVTLSGTASSDPDSDTLSYQWSQLSGPSATLSDANAASPTFTAPGVGPSGATLTFQLTVNDGNGGSDVDTVIITVHNVNQPPVANAGEDQQVNEGILVSLDGTDSSDPDGDTLTYQWTRFSGPTVTLNYADTPTPTFTGPILTDPSVASVTLVLRLTVNDGFGGTHFDDVSIEIINNDGRPIANAGTDQEVTEGDLVTLDSSYSSDPDGVIASYAWTQVLGQSVSLSSYSAQQPTFTAPNVGPSGELLRFSLLVTDDNDETSIPDSVDVMILNKNVHPIAMAGDDQEVDEETIVTLSGAGSFDPDAVAGDILQYDWTQIAGITVSLSNRFTISPTFTAPSVATTSDTLVFQLTVVDALEGNAIDFVEVSVRNVNKPPIANAGIDQTVNEGTTVTLTGLASNDPDGDPLAYSWLQVSGPSTAALADATAASTTFRAPDVTGQAILTFELTVTDSHGVSSIDAITVTVNNVVGYNVQGFAPSFAATGNKDFDIPDSSYLRLATFSAAAWFKTSANYAGNAMIVNKGGLGSDSAGQNMNYGIWLDLNEKLVAGFEKASGGADITVISTNSYNNGQWYYAVVTFDGSTVKLYVNGVLIGTKAGTGPETNVIHPLTIGANSNPLGNINYFNGEIDEVRIWTYALTAQDVSEQYNAGGITNYSYRVYMDGNDYNLGPVANAGPDVTVQEFDLVSLSASASTDPDGDSLSYAWTQVGGPAVAAIQDAGTLSFTAPAVTTGIITLTFELLVKDPSNAQSSDTITVIVQNNNQLPVAIAGPDLAGDEGSLVSFDGSASYDPDTDPITYSWKQLSGPTVTITGATTATPSFNAPAVANTVTLTFELSISDGLATAKDTVNVLVYNVLGGYRYDPEFTATGSNEYKIPDSTSLRLKTYSVETWFRTTQTFTGDVLIVNKGGFGSDSAGQNMNYGIWMNNAKKIVGGFETSTGADNFVTAPNILNDGAWHYVVLTFDGSSLKLYIDGAVAITKATTAQPESTGTYPVVLGANSRDVTKNKFKGDIDEVKILNRVMSASEISYEFDLGQSDSTGLVVYMDGVKHNSPPVANAGPDKTVYEDDLVTLTGSGSTDPNGNPLTYSWVQIAGPVVTLSSSSIANPQFTAPAVPTTGATLTFSLTVSDGQFDRSDTVTVYVNNLSTFFEATGSNYMDVPYLSMMKLPQFSLATKFKTSSDFTGDAAIVNRGGFGSDSAGQNMNYGIWMNNAEKIVGGFETSSGADNYVTSPNSYKDGAWHSAVITFSGSSLKLYVDGVQVASKSTTAKPDSTGTQPLRLGANSRAANTYFVGDIDETKVWNRALSASEITNQFSVSSTALAGELVYYDGLTTFFAPVANAGPDQTTPEGIYVTLDGTASYDVYGNPLAFSWKQTAGPSVTLTNPTTSKATFKAPTVTGTTSLTFELKVSNDRYSSTNTVVISVTDAVVVKKVLPTFTPTGGISYMNDVTNAIKSADDYIYGAFFYVEDYTSNKVLNELENAIKNRGVDVKLVVSTHALTLYPNIEAQLTARGIPVHIDSNHAKVVVIDDRLAYIGSANWNKNGLQNNWELTYKSDDPAVIAEAKEFVSTLWYKGSTTVKYNSLSVERPVNGQEYVDQVLSILKGAQSSSTIQIAMFEAVYDKNSPNSAHSQILWEIKNAKVRGVNLQMLLDDPRYYNHTGGAAFLAQNNIPHKLDDLVSGYLERKHVKAFLVDDTLVIGSHNWNWDSANSSQEYSIIVRDKSAVNAEFSSLFSGIWNKGIWKVAP